MIDWIDQKIGNYHITRLIGQGGFADVYLGEHIYLQTPAAIKVLQMRLTQATLEKFLTEARIIARLTHPNIIPVLEFGIEDNTPFLVMGYAAHGSLRQRHTSGSIIDTATVVSYVKQIALALQYAHDRDIVHRDIKPENILLINNETLMLSDFGIAMSVQNIESTLAQQHNTSGTAGTVTYMAPEQFNGKPVRASDQYALGVVAYEWLCGTPPFTGSAVEVAIQHFQNAPPLLRKKLPTLTPAIEQVIMQTLAKDPLARFASVQNFATALEKASLAKISNAISLPGTFSLKLPALAGTASEEVGGLQPKRLREGYNSGLLSKPLILPAVPQDNTEESRSTGLLTGHHASATSINQQQYPSVPALVPASQKLHEVMTALAQRLQPVPHRLREMLATLTQRLQPVPHKLQGVTTDLAQRLQPVPHKLHGVTTDLAQRLQPAPHALPEVPAYYGKKPQRSMPRRKVLLGLGLAGLATVGLITLGTEAVWNVLMQPDSTGNQGPSPLPPTALPTSTPTATPNATTIAQANITQTIINTTTTRPALTVTTSGQLDLFIRGSDSALWHRSYTGNWGNWESLGDVLLYDPAVTSWAPGRFDVLMRGSDNSLEYTWFDGTWHPWASQGGVITGNPAAVSWGPQQIDVFARGSDMAMWHKAYIAGAWQNWEPLGNNIASNPTVAAWGPQRLDVFTRGYLNDLMHIWFDGTWHSWESLGGSFTLDPCAVSPAPGVLDIFVRGLDNSLQHKRFDGTWHAWEALGGVLTSAPSAVAWNNNIQVFIRGTDNALQYRSFDGNTWHPWQMLT